MTSSDEIDQKIISILKYGERQQSEIVEIVDRNESTVRRHLKYLDDESELSRDESGNQVYYYLESAGREIVPPKPYADSEEVSKVLYNIHRSLGLSNNSDTSTQNTLLDHMYDLHGLSLKYYHVVNVDQNLNFFFNIFDHLVGNLKKNASSKSTLMLDDIYYLCISAADYLYSNWEIGKENKDYHQLLTNRITDIQSIIGHVPKNIELSLQSLLFSISNEEGQKAFISMVNSGKYRSEELLNGPIYVYNQKNDLDKLLDDLNKVIKQTENSDQIQDTIDDIKSRFVRSFDNI